MLALAAVVGGPRLAGLLVNTLAVALPSAALATLVAIPLALLIAKTDVPGRRAAVTLFAALLLLPLHACAAGWLAALGHQGWITALAPGGGAARAWLDALPGAVFLHAVAGVPWAVLLLAAALRAVDPRREEQALLDAPPWRVLMRVSIPEAWPGLLVGFGWVALIASTEIAITDLMRVRTFAEEVYTQAALGARPVERDGGGGLLAYGLSLAAVGSIGLGLLLLLEKPVRRALGTQGERPWRWRLAAGERSGAMALLVVAALGIVAAPIGSLVYQAGLRVDSSDGEYRRVWSAGKAVAECATAPRRHRREVRVSFALGAAVAIGSTIAGAAIAWRLRRADAASRGLLLLLAVALAVPGPVWAWVVIRTLNQPPDAWLAPLGELYGTWFAPWLVQMIRVTPYLALWLWPAAASVPRSVLDAARADGAGPIRCAVSVAAPMRRHALAAALVAGLALSVGELSATALVVPPGTPPLSVRLLSLLHYGVEDRVAAICLDMVLGYTLVAMLIGRLAPPPFGGGWPTGE